ncbi:DUF1643 domain-containing protein [Albidovulum sediminicola]|uniref:DUF1643 domain-containing protein n=1 Tax=Albidovulum sediminicola TaxID=2984331 RepID=A0ABT2YYA5_9RHOB|nr:DUF1643 domain-containing protein [Defluviimonas sp. WL0075]MCV2863864.1 DUF1643 domain-containing protein [Defluviimonas sp. WL0075]
MIIRRHQAGGTASEAHYSDCGHYRYLLTRRWGAGDVLLYILLNPSTATEERNDPTIERCERRARALGFDGFAVANLFAWRATRPEDLKCAPEPVGPENEAALLAAAAGAGMILCGWGLHGAFLGRGALVAEALRARGHPLCHLGLTKSGAPRHPLYVPYAQPPQPWR